MKLAVMQPYFLPYIGYFHLMAAVDAFVVYDAIKYTKKGWINRNRILCNGADAVLTLPLKRGSDALDVVERELAVDFEPARLLDKVAGAYRSAPCFGPTYDLVERILRHEERNLFAFLLHSLARIREALGLSARLLTASTIAVRPGLRGQDRVLAICEAAGATTYINPIGGTGLYAKETFRSRGIELRFVRARSLAYHQFGGAFVPWLSIIDVLMFNPVETVRTWVTTNYDLVEGA